MSPRAEHLRLALAALWVLGGCLEPQVSDELVVQTPVYQSADEVPAAEDDPALESQLRAHQGFATVERAVSCESVRWGTSAPPDTGCADRTAELGLGHTGHADAGSEPDEGESTDAGSTEDEPTATDADIATDPNTVTIKALELQWGFVHGHWAWFWDFGPGTLLLAPVYLLVSQVTLEPFDFTPLPGHPPLFGLIPGQTGYTPLWQVVLVPITPAYSGERITSVGAIQAGREEGLLADPIALDMVVDCPIVHRETFLEVWSKDWTPKTQYEVPKTAYWEGHTVAYFDLGVVATDPQVQSGVAGRVLTLRREGEEPLDEALRGVDMTGDGDLDDTNHIFDSEPGDAGYTPMVSALEVVVVVDTVSVDNTNEEVGPPAFKAIGDVMDEDGRAVSDQVVALYPQNQLRYLPRWVPPPSPTEPDATVTSDAVGADAGGADADLGGDTTSEADTGPVPDAGDAIPSPSEDTP